MEILENKSDNKKEINKKNQEQIITLANKSSLSISGTEKIISLKSDLIQLATNYGGIAITGNGLELIKLDNNSTTAEIKGNINSIRFVEGKSKQSILGKIFK